MKISIVVCVGNQQQSTFARGDPIHAALYSYTAVADEVIVVNGHRRAILPKLPFWEGKSKIKVIQYPWPYQWSWEEFPKHLNRGLEQATGDWVIRCDIDYIFHENDIDTIRTKLQSFKNIPVATFQKWCFVKRDCFYEKGWLPLAINRKLVGDSYQFGHAVNAQTDLCYPIEVQATNNDGIPVGLYLPKGFKHTGVPVYNYDCTFRTQEMQRDEFWRYSQAYYNYFQRWRFGSTPEESFAVFKDMMQVRAKRCTRHGFTDHPRFIKGSLTHLHPSCFGYNLWNNFT